MSYCFMRLEKIKTESHFNRSFEHNYRTGDVPNADPALKEYNENLIELPEGENYYSAFQKKINEAPGYADTRPRRDAVKGIELVLTYNASTVDNSFDMEAWKRENVEWLRSTFGTDNVISAVLHNDEAGSPHIHAVVIPMRDGRLNARYYTGGVKAMRDLQTSYGKAMEKVGLERGLEFSKAEHVDINRFYSSLNKVIDEELPQPEMHEDARTYRERANEIYVDSNLKHFGEVKKLERKIDEARTIDMTDTVRLAKLKKMETEMKKTQKQAIAFRRVLSGLKNGYFDDPEKNEEFKRQMQEIADWQAQREKQPGIIKTK